MRRLVAPVLTIAVLLGLIALFRYAQRYDPARIAPQTRLPEVSIRLTDATIISRHAGKPRWSLHTDKIDVRPLTYGSLESFRAAELTGIRAGTLYREGKREATFSAEHASFDQASQQLDIRGKLRLDTVKGDRIEAPECVWSEREDAARLPQGARARFRGNTVNAPFLLYSPKRHTVQCPQGVEGRFDGYPLRAAAIDWDVDKGTVHCTGPVSGERRSYTYTVQEAWLDLKKHEMWANKGTAHLRIGSDGTLPEERP
jgi:hypothetical protein